MYRNGLGVPMDLAESEKWENWHKGFNVKKNRAT